MKDWLTAGAKDLLIWQAKVKGTSRGWALGRRFKQRIYWRDDGCCGYCGVKVPYAEATLDHVKPLVYGGKRNAKENVVIACRQCNNEKGPLLFQERQPDLEEYALAQKWAERRTRGNGKKPW